MEVFTRARYTRLFGSTQDDYRTVNDTKTETLRYLLSNCEQTFKLRYILIKFEQRFKFRYVFIKYLQKFKFVIMICMIQNELCLFFKNGECYSNMEVFTRAQYTRLFWSTQDGYRMVNEQKQKR